MAQAGRENQTMNTPRVIRLNGEDNVVIAIDLVN